jgi:hypothetical protein
MHFTSYSTSSSYSVDGSNQDGEPLNYAQKFLICTLPGVGGNVSRASDAF